MAKNNWLKMRSLGACLLALPVVALSETVGIFLDQASEQFKFAAGDVESALQAKNFTVEMLPLGSLNSAYAHKKVVIALIGNSSVTGLFTAQGGALPTNLGEQAYGLRTTIQGQPSFWVLGGDTTGAMYGSIQLAENIGLDGFSGNYSTQESPFLKNRGIKLNMPLDRRIPTYVGGWTSRSTKRAIPHAWDMTFWKSLIDQQARYRYNVLSIWVHHPFPALVKSQAYPNASLPSIEGFDGFTKNLNHDQRVAFWREVMKYAHDRGMKVYFFNWNMYFDYAQDHYDLKRPSSPSEGGNTEKYMYASMTALLETYPELDGWGLSAGDGMNDELPSNEDKAKWTWYSMGKAVHDYLLKNPGRKFNLIHRGIYSSPSLVMNQYDPIRKLPNATLNYSVKYAQAHMYSTPTPKWTGDLKEFGGANINTWLTIRNDSYFYINWGDPQFVKDYMNGIPNKSAVDGMYIGADGYTPTRTYFYKNNALNGMLEVERRWYMEMLWGRISYNPNTSEDVFKGMLAKRFNSLNTQNLYTAWTLASRPLPKATEIVMGTWSLDFAWWPEACWSDPGRGGGFKTIDGFATTEVANGSNLCNIANSASKNCGGKKTAYALADEMQKDAEQALAIVSPMNSAGTTDMNIAVTNIKQMAYLGNYYAYKIRGATQKKASDNALAKETMAKAYCFWFAYSRSMEDLYYADSMRNVEIYPDWKFGDAAVLKEYTDLGGTGTPTCSQLVGINPDSTYQNIRISIQSFTSKGIQFHLPEAGVAEISIYNSKGKILLQDKDFTGIKGVNEIRFSTKMGTGLYFYKIESGKRSAVGRATFANAR